MQSLVLDSPGKWIYPAIAIPGLIFFAIITARYYSPSFTMTTGAWKNGITYTDKNVPEFTLDGRKYSFTRPSVLFFIACGPLLTVLLLYFLDINANQWLPEIAARTSDWFLNLFFGRNTGVTFVAGEDNTWGIIDFTNGSTYLIGSTCAAIHVFSFFGCMTSVIPHSRQPGEGIDIAWRKSRFVFISFLLIFYVNCLRIVAIVGLVRAGANAAFVHDVLYYISALVAVIAFIGLARKWLPEFFLAYYFFILTLISKHSK